MTPPRAARTRRARLACVLAACAAVPIRSHAATPPAVEAVVEQPRAFGHVVGDMLTQRVRLSGPGIRFEPAALPGPARLGVWLERRAARIESSGDGTRWLVVDYQIVNAPQALTSIRLPDWVLPGAAGAAPLHVAAELLTVAPLTLRDGAGADTALLRPDRDAPRADAGTPRRRLLLCLAALGATLAAWAGWVGWRRWRATATQPFAHALRELRRLPRDEGSGHPHGEPRADAARSLAYQALHRAFDRTAGQITRASTLHALFERAPHFEPLRPRIEQFYAQSAALFFGAGAPPQAVSPAQLCRDLRRLERANER